MGLGHLIYPRKVANWLINHTKPNLSHPVFLFQTKQLMLKYNISALKKYKDTKI